MKIEIKANIGDEIFFMYQNKVTSSTVTKIAINVKEQKSFCSFTTITVVYTTNSLLQIFEECAFLSKKELLEIL